MKFRGIAICLLVALFGMMSTMSYGSPQTRVMSISGKKGWLGVEIQDVTKRLKEKQKLTVGDGAYVTNVVEDSPAEDAGIKEGDVIVKIDGNMIDDSDDLTKAVQKIKPKTEVKVEIVRGSDKKTLTAKIGKSRAPQAFSFGFGDRLRTPSPPHIATLPKMRFKFFSQNDMNGLELQTMSKQLADYFEVPGREGILISNVEKGSTAEKAGFKAGDVLTKIDGMRIDAMDDVHESLEDNEGKDVKCDVLRKGKSVTLTWHIEREDNDDEEDEDDDMSFDVLTPHGDFNMMPFHWTPEPSRPKIQRFRDEMREFKRELKEKLMDVKREIKSELADWY